jgi:hypothetical protein
MMKLIAQAPTQTLSLRFENQIERCLLGFSELTKPGLSEHTGQARLSSLSSQASRAILRQRMRAAKRCRSRVVKTAHGVQVLFHPIVGKGLDQHNRAVLGQRSVSMPRRAHRVAVLLGQTAPAVSKPLLSKRRLNLAHFHLSDVGTELDSG